MPGMAGKFRDRCFDVFQRVLSVDREAEKHAGGQFIRFEQILVQRNRLRAGVAVGDAGQPDLVVVRDEFL